MNVKTQTFLVVGISKSGAVACEYILNNGGTCYFYEQIVNEKINLVKNKLIELGGVELDLIKAEEMMEQIDVVVVSPGVPINHRLTMLAKEKNKRIISEFEFGFEQLMPTTIAVTGTNGKTTTVHLINEIIKCANKNAFLVGNVGIPVTSKVNEINKNDICVAEVSSFQLETTTSFCPHISCILNISPDHLERHYSMENYIFLKKRIFKNQKESEYAVLNFDDQTIKSFVSEIKAKVIFVSIKERVDGAYLKDGFLYYKDTPVIQESDLALKGEHNVYNALFCIAVCQLLKIDCQVIATALKNFKGIPHRLQLINEKNGVKYYNDSKSTNTASSINAIKSMKGESILIVGGSEKGESYLNLFNTIKNSLVKHTVITGASRFKMMEDAVKAGVTDFTATPNFSTAVSVAFSLAQPNDNVLLSPACASFDSFSNYEERGQCFISEVEKL